MRGRPADRRRRPACALGALEAVSSSTGPIRSPPRRRRSSSRSSWGSASPTRPTSSVRGGPSTTLVTADRRLARACGAARGARSSPSPTSRRCETPAASPASSWPAGARRRFGGDKLAVEVDERPLLHRAIAARRRGRRRGRRRARAPRPRCRPCRPMLAVPIRVARDARRRPRAARRPRRGARRRRPPARHPRRRRPAVPPGGRSPSARRGDGPGRGEPVAGEPVGGEPVAGEPVAGEPTAGASAAGDRGPDVAILDDGDRIWPFPVAVRVATVRPAAEAALPGPRPAPLHALPAAAGRVRRGGALASARSRGRRRCATSTPPATCRRPDRGAILGPHGPGNARGDP